MHRCTRTHTHTHTHTCMHTHACTHTRTCVHAHASTHMRTRTCMHRCTHTHACTQTHAHTTHTCMHAHTLLYTHMYAQTHTRAHTQMHTRMHAQTHAHARTHTHNIWGCLDFLKFPHLYPSKILHIHVEISHYLCPVHTNPSNNSNFRNNLWHNFCDTLVLTFILVTWAYNNFSLPVFIISPWFQSQSSWSHVTS